MAQWIAHWTSNPGVAGSNPVQGVKKFLTKKALKGIEAIQASTALRAYK